MRAYSEPTARNLLRRPLVFGVPLFGLIGLSFLVLGISVLFGTAVHGNLIAIAVGVLGYFALRVVNRFARFGWEEAILWQVERRVRVKNPNGRLELLDSSTELASPDTFDESGLISAKEALVDQLVELRAGERITVACSIDASGARMRRTVTSGRFDLSGKPDWPALTGGLYTGREAVYSFHQLPVLTDPLWFFSILSRISKPVTAIITVRGVDFQSIKRRIEVSRRSSARGSASISDIDADVTFEESSTVLKGLSRGDEAVVELSLVLLAPEELDLDPSLFCRERIPELAVSAVLGLRRRLHRSHFVRAVTACDLIPNLIDPVEPGPAILTTLRGKPLYFSPADPRLEALHWLVVGASGSGKSFFAGLVLKRMIEGGTPMSVLFVDHNRSFRRLVRSFGNEYLEPSKLVDLNRAQAPLFQNLDKPGRITGIELSNLAVNEKKNGARLILGELEEFLRTRESIHPVYVVLDECWNFMRDEPVLVQRAFREFRKLNGAAVAITQSLSDFLTDESGQSIFQNAPIRILLRQGEDISRYQGILGLNAVEAAKVRSLRQQKGAFSECLIKTPFLSRLGRLYPTDREHTLLRTDNLREELIAESRLNRSKERSSECATSLL